MRNSKTFMILCIIILTFSLLISCGSNDENVTDGDNDNTTDGDNNNTTDGDNDTSDGDSVNDQQAKELEETLENLGADLDSYEPKESTLHPLGLNTLVLNKLNELTVIGQKTNSSSMNVILNSTQNFEAAFTETDSTWPDEGLKGGTACDVDGDGLDEIVVIIVGDNKLQVRVYDNQESEFAILSKDVTIPWGFAEAANDIDVACGDVDADSKSEIIVVASETHTEELDTETEEEEPETETYYNSKFVVLDDSPHNFETIFSKDYKDFISIRVDAGNLDDDLNDEIAMSFANKGGTNLFEIWDMGENGLEEIEDGTVEWINNNGTLKVGMLSDVVIGDVDADGLGELIFSGIHESYLYAASKTFVVIYDDALNDFETITFYSENSEQYPAIPGNMNLSIIMDRFVELVDLDGDFKPEIMAGNIIFKNLYDSDGKLEEVSRIPIMQYNYLLPQLAVTGSQIKRSNHYVAIGDFTGDAKEDIAIINKDLDGVTIWGNKLTGEFAAIEVINTKKSDSASPLLISANVNKDSIVVKYEGDYKFVFTEPIVMAALASPPCKEGIGQNLDSCSTTFGNATSESTTLENAITLRASFIVGTSIEDRTFTQSAFELEASISTSITASTMRSYSEEVAVSYSTGATEDAVVFSTIPYDIYTYTITSHPEEGMVGTKTTVAMPRKPIVLIAEREFFNNSVLDGIKIDDSVFKHTVQDFSSYPSKADKNSLMKDYGGMESKDMSVGQGTGATEVSLTVSEEWGVGLAMEVGVDLSIKTTAGGVTLGLSLGLSVENSISFAAGKSTSFAGSVGSIDAEHFADNQFTYGLFSYPFTHQSGQQFYVLNYWVEEN